jgi:hypothetical protein
MQDRTRRRLPEAGTRLIQPDSRPERLFGWHAPGQRCYSTSARLRLERPAYFATPEATQKGDLDITDRLVWFLAVLDQALSDADGILAATIRNGRFWEAMAELPLNPRQREVLNRLLDGFEGKLTSSKWARIAKCSQDTALRDIADLTARGVFAQDAAGGRSTSYRLKGKLLGEFAGRASPTRSTAKAPRAWSPNWPFGAARPQCGRRRCGQR